MYIKVYHVVHAYLFTEKFYCSLSNFLPVAISYQSAG